MNNIIKHIKSKTSLPEQEIWWMLESITHKTKEQLILFSNVSNQELQIIDKWIEKITIEHMPLAYLIGWVPFLDLHISIKPPILIPRPETEEWVHNTISTLQPNKTSIKTILDIGTGSGCIGLALAQKYPNAHVTAIDINHQALLLAKQNAIQNNITNITFKQSDLFEKLSNKSFDLIVSNPPYINHNDSINMMPQVTHWEDKQALFAHKEGLEIIEKILQQAKIYLNKNISLPYQLVLEYGYNQHIAISFLAQKHQWIYSIHKDSFGNFRTINLSLQ